MIIIMAGFTLMSGLALYAFLKTEEEWWRMCSFVTGSITILMITIALSRVINMYQLPEERDDMQNQVNHAVEDGPSDYERKTIREEIFKINEKISEAKRDNNNWLLGFQTPDIVDRIAPVRMIE